MTSVMGVLQRLEEPNTQAQAPERGLHEGERLLAAHADALFGKARGASIRIMVTLPLKRRTTATSSKR